MTRTMTAIYCACLLTSSAVLAAQQPPAMGTMPKDKMAEEMKVTGCLAESADMGHFMLNNAMMSDSKMAMPKDAPAMKDDMKPMSYTLTGKGLKAHAGHKVEVTGTMVHDAMAQAMPKDTMIKDGMATMGTLNVKSVKMLSATCK